MFDSIGYLKGLEAEGVSPTVATLHAKAMVDLINSELATKNDLSKVEFDIRTDFAKLRSEFAELRGEFAELKIQMSTLENRLLVKLGALMITLFTVGSAVMGFVIKHA